MSETAKKRYIPLSHWNKYHDYPSVSGLRHLVFHSDTNGFNVVIRRNGRRVLIDEDAYFSWMESLPQGNNANPRRRRKKGK